MKANMLDYMYEGYGYDMDNPLIHTNVEKYDETLSPNGKMSTDGLETLAYNDGPFVHDPEIPTEKDNKYIETASFISESGSKYTDFREVKRRTKGCNEGYSVEIIGTPSYPSFISGVQDKFSITFDYIEKFTTSKCKKIERRKSESIDVNCGRNMSASNRRLIGSVDFSGYTVNYDVVQDSLFIDLGLPSGTKWAKYNIGATSEIGFGDYFQYGKGANTYENTSGDSVYSGNENPLAESADTATQVWGNNCCMPTWNQIVELSTKCRAVYVQNYNGSGVDVTILYPTGSTSTNIIFPMTGYYNVSGDNTTIGIRYNIWSNTASNSTSGGLKRIYRLQGDENAVSTVYAETRRNLGYTIRAVLK